jgi:predicted Zn-dependent protease
MGRTLKLMSWWLGLMVPLLAQTADNAGMNLYSPAQEIALGRASLAQLEKSSVVVREPVVNAYLGRLGGELARHATGDSFPYSFTLFDDRRVGSGPTTGIIAFPFEPGTSEPVEALALAGGPVLVPVRLWRAIHSEPELAAVLAHAIAHIALRHPTRLATRRQLAERAAPARPQYPEAEQLVQAAILQFVRRLELDADELAVRILSAAGYEPAALVSFLRRLPLGESSSGPQLGAAHPSPEARIKVLQETIESLPRRNHAASTGQFATVKAIISRLP